MRSAAGEDAALEEALADIRRFRAALADALDVRIEVAADIAAGVLARELRLAPADLRAIVARELALAGEPPVTHSRPSERMRSAAGLRGCGRCGSGAAVAATCGSICTAARSPRRSAAGWNARSPPWHPHDRDASARNLRARPRDRSAGAPLDGGPPLGGRRVALRTRGAASARARAGRAAVLDRRSRDRRVADVRARRTRRHLRRAGIRQKHAARVARLRLHGRCGRRRPLRRARARSAALDRTPRRAHDDRLRDQRRPPNERIACVEVAFAHAAALRDRGLHVAFVLDSLARFAAALRETATARGESVGRGGYPPSVFAHLARFVEVAGPLRRGSITLIATVLSDGDDRDPVSDAARSLLDGHLQLSPRLAAAGRFPAIDVPASASRTMEAVARPSSAAMPPRCGPRWRCSTGSTMRGLSGISRMARPPADRRGRAAAGGLSAPRRAAVGPGAHAGGLAELADTLEGPIWT